MPLIKKFRISGRDNPRFRVELSNLITERNASWAKAKSINSPVDCTVFRVWEINLQLKLGQLIQIIISNLFQII